MSVKPDPATLRETRNPRNTGAPQLAPFHFTKETARAAALKSHEVRRARKEQLAAGPREALALGLMDELEALRAGTRLLVQDFASSKAEVRKAARRDMGAVLNQALGTIERRSDVTASEGDTLPADRETRMRLLAELDALSED